MLKRILVCLIVLSLLASPAFALPASPWTNEATTSDKCLAKLKFGLKNLVAGWTEIFSEPHEAWKEGGNVFEGAGRGLFHGVYDTVGGALHVVTCPIPLDIPLPEGGADNV